MVRCSYNSYNSQIIPDNYKQYKIHLWKMIKQNNTRGILLLDHFEFWNTGSIGIPVESLLQGGQISFLSGQ